MFSRLRTLRKTVAERGGVPPYVVFNNERPAEMFRRGVKGEAWLMRIPGFGPARNEK